MKNKWILSFIYILFTSSAMGKEYDPRSVESIKEYKQNPRNQTFPGSFGRVQSIKQQRMEESKKKEKEKKIIDNGNGTTTNRALKMWETK